MQREPDYLLRIFDRDDRLVALHSSDAESLIKRFSLLCRSTGRSMYHWSDHRGLVSLKASDIAVPGCRKLADALRYVIQSMHYGIYIFTGFERHLRSMELAQLKEIAELREQRMVILVGEHIDLPSELSDRIYHVIDEDGASVSSRPRLRDGRWVI